MHLHARPNLMENFLESQNGINKRQVNLKRIE